MISAALIVKNEEELLANCLKSLKGIDEVVICDTGSEDKTIEIARKHTDKVFTDYKWNDNFAEARNHAISKCSGDWILTIDADDTLEKNGIKKIRKLIKDAKPKQSVFDFYVRSDRQHFWQPRLFRNNGKILYVGAIHNYLNTASSGKVDIKITFGYSPAHKKDPNRALRILKKVVAENPKLVREKFYLAREYWYRRDYVTAIYWYEEYLKSAYWGPEMAEARYVMAKCYWYLRKGEKAREECMRSIALNTNFKEALKFMAEISGPGNKKRWLEFAETASNEGVLFIRKT